jgi:hypothetical protein
MQVGNILPEKINSAKKKQKASGSGFSVSGEAREQEDTGKVNIGKVNVSSLWTLQTMDDDFAEREKFTHSSKEIIDELKELRFGLLDGAFGKDNILKLTKVLENADLSFQNTEMQQLFDEVTLRAAIELAKLEKASKDS